jgi:hypothetical protein
MTSVAGLLAYEDGQVKPGWIAFFVVMILCLATFLLWRSMNTQLGRIRVPPRASFDGAGRGSAEPTEAGARPARDADADAGAGAADESDEANGDQPPPA